MLLFILFVERWKNDTINIAQPLKQMMRDTYVYLWEEEKQKKSLVVSEFEPSTILLLSLTNLTIDQSSQ